MSQFVTERRNELFFQVLKNRTRHLTVVLEDIYQPHNASAVLRTCDCMGVQDVFIIENRNRYELNPGIELGAAQWLTLQKFNGKENNTADCFRHLKSKGYRIVATSLREKSITIKELDVTKPFALVMGTEKSGISDVVYDMADELVYIPMMGFTESYNISVATSLCLYEFTNRVRSEVNNWWLSPEEQHSIYLNWLRNTITRCELVENEYHRLYGD